MMATGNDTLLEYYARRAGEYERVYAKPERQADLRTIEHFLNDAFRGEQLFEVACGTGYWTQFIAKSATGIFATDYNPEVIELARQKNFSACRVKFANEDAYLLDGNTRSHTAGFHAFWWSHLPRAKIDTFLSAFHARLSPGAKVVMIDNAYVKGSNTPISRCDDDGNTYQTRKLDNGSEYEVLKNFPTESILHKSLSGYAKDISVTFLQYFWIAEYRVESDFLTD